MVSLGSITAAILFPILVLFIKTNYIVEGNYFIYSLIIAVMVVFNHRENVKRLLSGTENKLLNVFPACKWLWINLLLILLIIIVLENSLKIKTWIPNTFPFVKHHLKNPRKQVPYSIILI